MARPTAIDLFSGAGGLSLGLRMARFQVIGAVEIEPLAVETYQLNHPKTRVWQNDVRAVDPNQIMQELGLRPKDLSLLAGCPPCQGFTSLRTRNGSNLVNDDRNELLFEFVRFAKEMQPKAIMLENVPALANDARFPRFLKQLRDAGYCIEDGSCQILDAAEYGVPQRRKRLILMAARDGVIEFASKTSRRRTVRDAIEWMEIDPPDADQLHDFGSKRSARIQTLISKIPIDGGSRSELPEDLVLSCHKRVDGFHDVYGRMSWDKVSPTITGGCFNPSKGRFLHPEADRPITLREAALLQSFPRTYSFSTRRGKAAAALMIGNALPPQFIRVHANALRASLARMER